nr:FeoA family protein [uncultured Dysosmobacter sp.]
MVPLTMVRAGETGTIRRITGKDELRQHLAELGFVVDGAVTVVSELGGNRILQVKDSRVALDRTLAGRIMIELEETR